MGVMGMITIIAVMVAAGAARGAPGGGATTCRGKAISQRKGINIMVDELRKEFPRPLNRFQEIPCQPAGKGLFLIWRSAWEAGEDPSDWLAGASRPSNPLSARR
jgi:hypothetical protein